MKSLFFVIFLGLLSRLTKAHLFMVGGEDGWTLKPSENYTHWSERNRFLVQDQLVFKYEEGMDSVFVVNKNDYATCNKDGPMKSLKNLKGESKFEFDRSGPFYFISGHEQNCEKGQKFIVIVLSTHHRPRNTTTHTAPSPKSQPPAIKPPSPSPSNNDRRSKSPSPSPVSNQHYGSKGPSPSPSSTQHQSESPLPSPISNTQHRSKSPSPSPSVHSPSKSPLPPPAGSTERHWISPISPSPSTQIHSKGPISQSPNSITPLVQPPSVNPNSPSPDIGAHHSSLQRHGRSPLGSPAPAPSSDAPGFCVGLKGTVLVMLVASAFII